MAGPDSLPHGGKMGCRHRRRLRPGRDGWFRQIRAPVGVTGPCDLGQGTTRRICEGCVPALGHQSGTKGQGIKLIAGKPERRQEVALVENIADAAFATDRGAHRLQVGDVTVGGAQRDATYLCDLACRHGAVAQTQRIQKRKQTKQAHRQATAIF